MAVLELNKREIDDLAVDKLRSEAKEWSGSHKVVRDGVLKALIHFCKQSKSFSKTVYESKKTFKGCMDAVLEKHGSCLSDLTKNSFGL